MDGVDPDLVLGPFDGQFLGHHHDATLADGCAVDGSVFNEKDTASGHLDDDKHWWMQAEALVGLAYAWKITGKETYFDQLVKVWKFIRTFVIDHVNGEWFGRLNKNGIPLVSDDKLGFWKCAYHNSRSMMEVMAILSKFTDK